MRSRLRFIVAIGLALVLGGWLAYTSLGGSLETYAGPAELDRAAKTYRLNGTVAPGAPKDAAGLAQSAEGLRFTVVDKETPRQRVPVLYRGTVPGPVQGRARGGRHRQARERDVRGAQRLAR